MQNYTFDNFNSTMVETKWHAFFNAEDFSEEINSKEFEDSVILNDVNLEKIIFRDVIFKERVFLKEGTLSLMHAEFHRCTFEKGLMFEGQISTLKLSYCKFKDDSQVDQTIHIKKLICKELSFRGNNFETHLHLLYSNFKLLEFIDCKGQSARINVYYCDVEFCLVKELKTGISLYNRNLIDSAYNHIKHIKIHLHPIFDSKLEFKDSQFEILEITGTNQKGTILFSDITVSKEVAVFHFFNNSIFAIYSAIVKGATLKLRKSSFGKSELNDINFKCFTSIEISKCNLQELQTSNVKWCKRINPQSKISLDNYSAKRETFRQLKLSANKQMDTVNELRFQNLEMMHYHNEIWLQSGRIGDKIILFFSLVTNRYGTSWITASIWVFFIAGVFYLYIKSLLGFHLKDFSPIQEHSITYFYEYIYSINPVRKLEESYGIHNDLAISPKIKTIDLLQRFIMSLLFYQFVSAFRKFSRK